LHHHGPHEFAPYNQGLPFGPHPHRGFETLTFIFEGEIEHADGHGHQSVIKSGGVQWMTAAKGIVHSENLSKNHRENGGKMEIIQLWMNLPAALKRFASSLVILFCYNLISKYPPHQVHISRIRN
jgi:redox-sensitive bicupin YhaK (pirin superfamily)